MLCSRHGDALEKNVLDSGREREKEREKEGEGLHWWVAVGGGASKAIACFANISENKV